MAVLNKEEFFNRVRDRIGDDSSDEAISFLEDVTDTYNNLENNGNKDGIDWEQRYRENDEAWKKRYANRFYNGSTQYSGCGAEGKEEEKEEYDPESITINKLFE